MAAGLYLWERDVVAPAARKHLGVEVARIEIKGTYACRRMYGHATGPVSMHATGEAIDVAGFRLRDGRLVSIERGWNGQSSRERAFLRQAHDGACRVFRGVLSPDYNAAHRDHFHFDMGSYKFCR
jgi:hypothetical protein